MCNIALIVEIVPITVAIMREIIGFCIILRQHLPDAPFIRAYYHTVSEALVADTTHAID